MRAAEQNGPLVRVGRRYCFSASHRLHSGLLSAERNREVYGKCNNPFGHGHDYVMEIVLAGRVDAASGRLVPLDLLDAFVQRVWLGQVDRRNLNLDLPEFAALVPTTENLAAVAARRLGEAWPHWFGALPVRLEKVRIHETRNNIFEVLVPQAEPGEQESHEVIVESRREGA
ncbi:MAG: 6-carboxytetrahydropterin synthase [Bryobacteraceae bacterium]|nr:6-carboxytetrahydropterin synthase [Bryobacteraceae bacterium]